MDYGDVIGEAFEKILDAFVSFIAGILNALLSPIRVVLFRFGISVGATGIIAPMILVTILGASVYILWVFWWAKGFLPKS